MSTKFNRRWFFILLFVLSFCLIFFNEPGRKEAFRVEESSVADFTSPKPVGEFSSPKPVADFTSPKRNPISSGPFYSFPSKGFEVIIPNLVSEEENLNDRMRYTSKMFQFKSSGRVLKLCLFVASRDEKEKENVLERWQQFLQSWQSVLPENVEVFVEFFVGSFENVQFDSSSAKTPDWVVLLQSFTYIHLENLLKQLISNSDPSAPEIRGGPDFRLRSSAEQVALILTVESFPAFKRCALDWICHERLGTQLIPMKGFFEHDQYELLKTVLDTSFFAQTDKYSSVGRPIDALARLPVVFGNTENKTLFRNQLLVDTKKAKVPKILHQMWIGPNPIRPKVKELSGDCRKMHESNGWTVMFWDDEAIQSDLLTNAPDLYALWRQKRISNIYHGVSDLIRLFILAQYGGVYIDIDAVCVQPMDSIVDYANHLGVDMLVGYASLKSRGFLVANGALLAVPSAPALTAVSAQIGENVFNTKGKLVAWRVTGPTPLTLAIQNWKTWMNVEIVTNRAFIPVHFTEKKNFRGVESSLEYARTQESYTIQLFDGTFKPA